MHKEKLQEKRMLSIRDLQERFCISYASAYELMRRLPCVDVAPEGSRYRTLRVSAWAVECFEKQRRCGKW